MADQKFKSKVKLQGGASFPAETASRAPVIDASGNLISSAVTSTELGYVAGLTSSAQTQIGDAQADATQALADAGAAQADATQALADAGTAQTAINNHLSDTTDAHDASAISNVPAGNLAATDLQGAVDELQSDVDSRALDSAVIKKNGSVAFTAAQSMGGFKLTSLAAPTAASDAANKGYVDSALEGLKAKEAVRVATTVAGTLASSFEDSDVIDGVTLVTGDRILVKDQASPSQNGIYIVQASGAPVRSTDFDSVSPIDEINKAFVAVQEGTSNAGKLFVQYGVVTTIGTDAINFVFFNSVSGLTGGDGITVSGSNISIDHDGEGLTFVATQLSLELDGSTLDKSASGLKLGDTAVTPASQGSATAVSTFTVDQQGRLTAAGNTTIAIPASQVTDFNEAAQDAVGTIFVDTASIDFTYTDGTPSITATVLPAGVDHDSLNNYVANDHVDHSTVSIATAADSGLTGGGDITATRNLSVDIAGTTALAATPAAADTFLVYDASATALKKVTYTELLAGVATGSAGDIEETSFSIANNQAAAASVTGFAFAAGVTRSFTCLVSVEIDATLDLFEQFTISGVNKAGAFDIAVSAVGDESGVTFSITAGGQIQYTSANYAGFSAGAIKFRAITTTV
jgi:hypothetical protein